jgi:hypothetical protein
MDVFNAGAGNDTITINASNITALEQTVTWTSNVYFLNILNTGIADIG